MNLKNLAEVALQRSMDEFDSLMKRYVEECPMGEVSQDIVTLMEPVNIAEFEKLQYFKGPLEYALDARKWHLCDWMIERGCDPNTYLVPYAIKNDKVALDYLVTKADDFETKKHSMFVWSVLEGHFDLAQDLLSQGANIDHRPPLCEFDGYALFHAAVLGKMDIVKWLMERGANPTLNREKILDVTQQRGLVDMHDLFLNL